MAEYNCISVSTELVKLTTDLRYILRIKYSKNNLIFKSFDKNIIHLHVLKIFILLGQTQFRLFTVPRSNLQFN